MIVDFELEPIKGYCLTACPNFGWPLHVGSAYCQDCSFCQSFDLEEQTVNCIATEGDVAD